MKTTLDPLHGMTLERIILALEIHYGWEALGRLIDIRCFNHDPSVKSSLTFLRRTPWAREKVEALYLSMDRAANKGTSVRQQEAPKAARKGSQSKAPQVAPQAVTPAPEPTLNPEPKVAADTTNKKPRSIPHKWTSFQ